MTDNLPHLFWPSDIGPFETELRELLIGLERATSRACCVQVVEQQLSELPEYHNADKVKLRYRAYLAVLLDLLRQGWRPECRQGRLYLWPPDWTQKARGNAEVQAQKEAIRESLQWERVAQFEKSSVRKFIEYMERERLFDNKIISIRSLFADGEQLATDLSAVLELEGEPTQYQALWNIIKPYLQLISSKSRCKYTGLKLNDIWRYLRYTWSIPYNSTPGRKMFYLIRDAGRPFHPIIGIAALGSSVIQITVRDDVIGWTPKAMEIRVSSEDLSDKDISAIAQMLYNTLQAAIDDIATEDLINDKELQVPMEVTITHLEQLAKHCRNERVMLLQQRQAMEMEQGSLDNQASTTYDERRRSLTEKAQHTLFRAKRASALCKLLRAKRTLNSFPPIESKENLRSIWKTSEGKSAIKTLIRENKKRRVGINMMDITVCGAVPPYNSILGGKLVAMLLTSPQIVYEYRRKYTDAVSNIASKMKGEKVRREPKLVFLGTTSLYPSASSQYNRIAIPVEESEQKIRYIKYGLTKGYGSVHLSKNAVEYLDRLREYTDRANLINNRFGEGVNPKLRRIRAGMSSVGLTAVDRFIKHRSQRIVYGVPLGSKAYAFLRGETNDPDYFFAVNSIEEAKAATDCISQFWISRWLLMRIRNPEILSKVRAFNVEDVLLSTEIWGSGSPSNQNESDETTG